MVIIPDNIINKIMSYIVEPTPIARCITEKTHMWWNRLEYEYQLYKKFYISSKPISKAIKDNLFSCCFLPEPINRKMVRWFQSENADFSFHLYKFWYKNCITKFDEASSLSDFRFGDKEYMTIINHILNISSEDEIVYHCNHCNLYNCNNDIIMEELDE